MRVIFRADGSSYIGLGHVIRSLALAEIVGNLFTERYLAIQQPSAAVERMAQEAKVELLKMPFGAGTSEALELATTFLRASDVVVLDGYGFDTAYQEAIKSSGCQLVAIDDLCAWPQRADLVINHAPGIFPATYAAPPNTRFCLGPEFSLVRGPFRKRFRLPTPLTAATKVVVCFGGADPLQLTQQVLEALLTLPSIVHVSLVIGSAFTHGEELRDLVASRFVSKARIYQNISADEMADLLLDHQVVVCPASTVLIEGLLLGCAIITGFFAENQRPLAAYVHAHQQAYSVGNFTDYLGSDLVAALAQGLAFLTTQVRQPYAKALKPEQLQNEFQELLNR